MKQLELLATYAWGDFPSIFKSSDTHFQIYSSPMLRCLKTAESVATSLDNIQCKSVRVEISPLIFEEGGCYTTVEDEFGNKNKIALKGSTSIELRGKFPSFYFPDGLEDGWYHNQFPEASPDYELRVHQIIEWIWAKYAELINSEENHVIVLVTHGNLISALLSGLLTKNIRGSFFCSSNTGISHLQLYSYLSSDVVISQGINKVTHLLGDISLIKGSHAIDDHWLQELIV
jgi:broad specificity phosphatase PhoE